MTEDKNNKRTDIERKLDRLIHLASESSGNTFVIPPDSAIEAYIFGSATKEQEQSVLTALEHSPSFRREMLEIMDDLEPLVDNEELFGRDAELAERLDSGQSRVSRAPSLWGSIKKVFTVRLLVPAVAAAVVTLLVYWQSNQQMSSWDLVAEGVDPGELISIQLKGASGQQKVSRFATAKEAAFGAFRQLLVLGSSGITVDPLYRNPTLTNTETLSHIVVLDDDKNILSHYEVTLPVSPQRSDSSIQVWTLLLPSRDLIRINMLADSILTILPAGSDRRGSITITIESDSGWSFTPPASFGFSK